MSTATPTRLHYTDSDEANALLATDPLALLIGFALDQQVPVQTAFLGPLKIKQRGLLRELVVLEEQLQRFHEPFGLAKLAADDDSRLETLPCDLDELGRAVVH